MKFINLGLTKYPVALLEMDIAVENVQNGEEECVFFTEHEALYSAGKSYRPEEFIQPPKLPVYYPNRGGKITVHSPGQLVIYPIVNLKKRNLNIHEYVTILEKWIIDVLYEFGITGKTSDKGVGVWVEDPRLGDAKIGFIGIHVSHGVTSHGLCFNVSNELSLFVSVEPCGLSDEKVLSLSTLDISSSIRDVMAFFIFHSPWS